MSIPIPTRVVLATKPNTAKANFYRAFHDYFVTHLPSSSLHPDSRSGPHHQLPRSSSKPHDTESGPSPAPLHGAGRDTTVVRIPLRSAKHHFGVSVSRGTRPYNEDTYQAGVIDIPAFAKRAPLNLTRAPASSPLQAYKEKKQQQLENQESSDGEPKSANGVNGDPQVFYFGVFDGHGGAECSGYLRGKLHENIEDTAKKYELKSTLKDESNEAPSAAESKGESKAPNDAGQNPDNDSSLANKLQNALMNSWKENVGGYFRRFKPPAFTSASETNHPTLLTVLTHAFLSTDLTFMLTQLVRSQKASDPIAADGPLNAHDSLDSPSLTHPPPPFAGGSTASIALISTPTPTPFWHPSTPCTLYTAHCGDTRILLSHTETGAAHPLTSNHHPSLPSEAARLRRYAAGIITDSFGEERMTGLANTRAFGDMHSKRLGVSAEPEVHRQELAAGQYAFMVLMSDGVSGCVTDQEVVDLVKEAATPEEGARRVVAFATAVGEEGEGDNATAIVVRLGGWERRNEGGGGGVGTREEREWRVREAEGGGGRRRT